MDALEYYSGIIEPGRLVPPHELRRRVEALGLSLRDLALLLGVNERTARSWATSVDAPALAHVALQLLELLTPLSTRDTLATGVSRMVGLMRARAPSPELADGVLVVLGSMLGAYSATEKRRLVDAAFDGRRVEGTRVVRAARQLLPRRHRPEQPDDLAPDILPPPEPPAPFDPAIRRRFERVHPHAGIPGQMAVRAEREEKRLAAWKAERARLESSTDGPPSI